MRNYTLSKEQSYAVQGIQQEKISCLQYLDKNNLCNTLVESIQEHLLLGKRTLAVVEDDHIASLLSREIENRGLGKYLLKLKNDDFLEEKDIAKLRAMIKMPLIDQVAAYSLKESENEWLHDRIQLGFAAMATKVFGDRRWVDLLFIRDTSDALTIEFENEDDFTLDQKEFWEIRKKIEESKALYTADNFVSENIFEVFNLSIDSKENILNLKERLILYKSKCDKVKAKLHHVLSEYKERVCRKIDEEYLTLSETILRMKMAIKKKELFPEEKNKSSVFNIFAKASHTTKTQEEELEECLEILKSSILIDLHIEKLQAEGMDYASITEQADQQLQGWRSTRESIVKRMVRALNKNNAEDATLHQVDQEIDGLYAEINKAMVFKSAYENNDMNAEFQFKSLSKISTNIKLLLNRIKGSEDLIIWQSYFHSQETKIKHIIQVLRQYDLKDWVPMYEKWYLDKLIQKYYQPESLLLESYLTHFQDNQAQPQENILKKIEHHFCPERRACVESLRSRNKNLYSQLFKKKNADGLRAFEIIWGEKSLLTQFFPIIIISSKTLRSNRLLKDGAWDQLYIEGTDIFNHIEKYRIIEHKTNFFCHLHSGMKVTNDLDISHDDYRRNLKILLHEYNYKSPISQLPVSDKLRAAKKLAKIILSCNQSVRILQLKNANIISVAHNRTTDALIKKYDAHGIKEIDTEDGLYEAVTECIIETERTQYLVYQDHLFNIEYASHFLWQLHGLDHFRTAGFKTIHVSSLEMYGDENYIEDLLDPFQLTPVENNEQKADSPEEEKATDLEPSAGVDQPVDLVG